MNTHPGQATALTALAMLVLALAACGCGVPQHAAESAVIELESAWNEIEPAATSFAPARAESLSVSIARANEMLERGEFNATLTRTRALRDSVRQLSRDLPALEADLDAQWTSMRSLVPATLDTLDRDLARGWNPRSAVPRTELRAARREADSLRNHWLEAEVAARSDHLAQAVTIGNQVKRRAIQLMAGSRP